MPKTMLWQCHVSHTCRCIDTSYSELCCAEMSPPSAAQMSCVGSAAVAGRLQCSTSTSCSTLQVHTCTQHHNAIADLCA